MLSGTRSDVMDDPFDEDKDLVDSICRILVVADDIRCRLTSVYQEQP
jgi:hypothetical protein